MRLAVSRTPRARGRINRLIVSIKISTGISGVGVPSGRRWPNEIVGWFRSPMSTVANHRGMARPMFIDSCVVGVNVYGRSPIIFNEAKKSISVNSIRAHLCPGLLNGKKSCFVINKMVHVCIAASRFGMRRVVLVIISREGSNIARIISGIPRI